MAVQELIALADLPEKCPEWPLSPWSTQRLIREGLLGCVKIRRKLFVTPELLAEYVRQNTQPARKSG